MKLKVHDSVFVPLAMWAMLIAGNYRCVTKEGPRAIKDAVHSDINASRAVYTWVVNLCLLLGAKVDLVPFDKYAAAAQSLGSPSSAARALYAGAPYIERVDRLVRSSRRKGLRCDPRQSRRPGGREARGEPQESRLGLGPRFVMVLDSELLDFSHNRISSHSQKTRRVDAPAAGAREAPWMSARSN